MTESDISDVGQAWMSGELQPPDSDDDDEYYSMQPQKGSG